jgi:hypothetical protein
MKQFNSAPGRAGPKDGGRILQQKMFMFVNHIAGTAATG